MKSRLQSTILIAMIFAVMALLITVPDNVYAGSAPTVTYDSYERVIIKHNHDFKIDYTIPGTDTECSLRSMENKVVIRDVDLNKTCPYVITDKKTKKRYKGTFKVKRKFPILNSTSKIKKYFKKKIFERKPIVKVYTRMSLPQVKKTAKNIFENKYYDMFRNGNTYSTDRYASGNTITLNGKKYYAIIGDYGYSMSKKDMAKCKKTFDSIAKSMTGSTRKKICKLDKWLAKNCKYDDSYECREASDALVKRKAVCEGFAYTIEAFCYQKRIPCIMVSWGDHAWNIVKISGKWYHVDATWDVCIGYGKHLLKGRNDKTFNKEHKINKYFYQEYKASKYFGKKNLSVKC